MALILGSIEWERARATWLVTLPLLASTSALAAEEPEPLTLLAGYSVQRDSNLFRRPDGNHPVIDGRAEQRSDIRQVAQLGFNLQQRYSNQALQLGALATRNYYSEFDFLDFTGLSYNARWTWQTGRWQGTLGANQVEAERSFADSLLTVRSVNTVRTYNAAADVRIRGDWRLGAGFTALTSRYSDASSVSLDFDQTSTDARLGFRTANDNELALVLRDTDGKSPNRMNTLIVDDEYEQREVRLDGRYRLAGRSLFTGYAGYARREYPETSFRNYSGVIGRLGYEFMFTPKLRAGVQARRELGAKEDLVDTYVITSAVAVNLDWDITSKITARLRREELRRDFKGDPGLGVLPSDGEKDGQASVGATLTYAPVRSLQIDLAYRRDARTREAVAADFSNSLISIGARFKR